MKRVLFFLLFSFVLTLVPAQEHRRYVLVWHDEFDSGVLDPEVWSKIPRSKANWAVHMSKDESLYAFEEGDLVLRGVVNDYLEKDTATFLTGGVWCKEKKTFGFGRIEVRAKFDVAQGYWPAIWMLPWTNHAVNWPNGGEIDIMEHFSYSPFVNHTVHSHYTHDLGRHRRPPYTAYKYYDAGQYNTYAVERFRDSLVFFVNDRRAFSYPRYRNGQNGQFPFDQYEFYLIMDAQLGLDGSPSIDVERLPVELRIDFVRYYELDTKTDVIPEPQDYQQPGTRRFRYRRMVMNGKEQFDNPDEYHIIVKRGKAKVSGNMKWAQSTLTQLIGEDGKIANLEIHDKAVCSYRGVSLDKYEKKLTFDEVKSILETMAFYKLNYLQWNGKGDCSKAEVNSLKEYASDMGIIMVDAIPAIPNNNRGGFLSLNAFGPEEVEALMAFSERCWRGEIVGESRLANFKERVEIHKTRFQNKK